MSSVRSGVAKGKPWVVYTVDVFQHASLRQQLGVGPVPCMVYFKDGREVERSTGWRPGFVLGGKLDSFFE
jgi:thioredoxin-like negative regulator of GroEL